MAVAVMRGKMRELGIDDTKSLDERDARKFNLAMIGGWKVFLLTSQTAKETSWLEQIAASLRNA